MAEIGNKSVFNYRKWLLTIVLIPVRGYRYFISPFLGHHCRFEPTCSHYAEQAILANGVSHGIFLTLKRLTKCHPWHPGGYDPVPSDNYKSNLK